jgi:hypothetical protein
MLRQVKSDVAPIIAMTLIAGTAVLLRLGLVLHSLR